VALGCDTFDCVIPTREARHGKLYVAAADGALPYAEMDMRLEKYKEDFSKIDETCDCYLCQHHHRAYLRHLFTTGEPLAMNLATAHNLKFYLQLMVKIRAAISNGTFTEFSQQYGSEAI